jgi:hypothetical protein
MAGREASGMRSLLISLDSQPDHLASPHPKLSRSVSAAKRRQASLARLPEASRVLRVAEGEPLRNRCVSELLDGRALDEARRDGVDQPRGLHISSETREFGGFGRDVHATDREVTSAPTGGDQVPARPMWAIHPRTATDWRWCRQGVSH